MSGSSTDDGERYRVERGTDGSYLVVDRGADRTQRIAIHRDINADSAYQEANTLSAMDDVTSTSTTPSTGAWAEIDRIVAESTAAVDAAHNFNHLLPADPAA